MANYKVKHFVATLILTVAVTIINIQLKNFYACMRARVESCTCSLINNSALRIRQKNYFPLKCRKI